MKQKINCPFILRKSTLKLFYLICFLLLLFLIYGFISYLNYSSQIIIFAFVSGIFTESDLGELLALIFFAFVSGIFFTAMLSVQYFKENNIIKNNKS